MGAKDSTRDTVTLPIAVSTILNVRHTTTGTFSSNADIISGNTTISVGGKNSNTSNSGNYNGGYWMAICKL